VMRGISQPHYFHRIDGGSLSGVIGSLGHKQEGK